MIPHRTDLSQTTETKPTIYLGGPDVFLPNAPEIGAKKQQLCLEFGFNALFPLDNNPEIRRNPKKIFKLNGDRMSAADIGLFNLTPFRGPSADPGTVFELGYMYAQNKALVGYTSNNSKFSERVRPITQDNDALWDASGFSVEPFGLMDNLVIVQSILDRGGFIEAKPELSKNPVDMLAAFNAFVKCLQELKRRAAKGTFDERTKRSIRGGQHGQVQT